MTKKKQTQVASDAVMSRKWKRLNLDTHFAGGYLVGKDDRHYKLVLECLDGEASVGLENMSDGVYYNRHLKKCFVVCRGTCYRYVTGDKMFPYYLQSVTVEQMPVEYRNAILAISKTPFATSYQKRIASAIERFIRDEKSAKMMALRFLQRKKILSSRKL